MTSLLRFSTPLLLITLSAPIFASETKPAERLPEILIDSDDDAGFGLDSDDDEIAYDVTPIAASDLDELSPRSHWQHAAEAASQGRGRWELLPDPPAVEEPAPAEKAASAPATVGQRLKRGQHLEKGQRLGKGRMVLASEPSASHERRSGRWRSVDWDAHAKKVEKEKIAKGEFGKKDDTTDFLGLHNWGNTCFFNGLVQLLASSSFFVEKALNPGRDHIALRLLAFESKGVEFTKASWETERKRRHKEQGIEAEKAERRRQGLKPSAPVREKFPLEELRQRAPQKMSDWFKALREQEPKDKMLVVADKRKKRLREMQYRTQKAAEKGPGRVEQAKQHLKWHFWTLIHELRRSGDVKDKNAHFRQLKMHLKDTIRAYKRVYLKVNGEPVDGFPGRQHDPHEFLGKILEYIGFTEKHGFLTSEWRRWENNKDELRSEVTPSSFLLLPILPFGEQRKPTTVQEALANYFQVETVEKQELVEKEDGSKVKETIKGEKGIHILSAPELLWVGLKRTDFSRETGELERVSHEVKIEPIVIEVFNDAGIKTHNAYYEPEAVEVQRGSASFGHYYTYSQGVRHDDATPPYVDGDAQRDSDSNGYLIAYRLKKLRAVR